MSESITSRVVTWLTDHPGKHRARDVAKPLGLTNAQAQSTLAALWYAGRIDRERVRPAVGLPYSLWGTDDGVVRLSRSRASRGA